VASISSDGKCLLHRPGMRFRLSGELRCLRHGLLFPRVLKTSVLTALVVGTILTMINQGNLILAGDFPAMLLWKIPLTYSVPFLVSSFAALRVSLVREG
jgi:hypothetical protein